MRKRILQHLARCVAILIGLVILIGLRRLLVCRDQYVVAKSRRSSWQDLRRGLTTNFVMTILILAMLTYFIWGFDYVDRLYDRVVMNLIPAFLPPVTFYEAMRQEPETRRFN